MAKLVLQGNKGLAVERQLIGSRKALFIAALHLVCSERLGNIHPAFYSVHYPRLCNSSFLKTVPCIQYQQKTTFNASAF